MKTVDNEHLNIEHLLLLQDELKKVGSFARKSGMWQYRDKKWGIVQDKSETMQHTFGYLYTNDNEQNEVILRFLNIKLIEAFSEEKVWKCRMDKKTVYVFCPKLIILDDSSRIQESISLNSTIKMDGKCLVLKINLPKKGRLEIPFLTVLSHERKDIFIPLQDTLTLEGCWSSVKKVSDFWHFYISGKIYSGRHGAYGRYLSAQTAYSIFKTLFFLYSKRGDRFFLDFMQEIAYAMLLSMSEEGIWFSGEWQENPEVHFRLQNDGAQMLLKAYELFGSDVFLEAAKKVTEVTLRSCDKLTDQAWWFLHDGLEKDKDLFEAQFPKYSKHKTLGKKEQNTLTLNTHVQALILFFKMHEITKLKIYQEAYEKGLKALRIGLSLNRGRVVHGVAEKILLFAFGNQKVSLLSRGFRRVARKSIVHRLYRIQKHYPRFMCPQGYLWRDLNLPIWGYWYHLVNLYDLLILYQLDQKPWLFDVIEKAMNFAMKSNLVEYLSSNKHYIAPQWLQILRAYSFVSMNRDDDVIKKECQLLKSRGYGIPIEYYMQTGNFLTDKAVARVKNC